MSASRTELLLACYIEDSLSPEDEQELADSLRKDPELIDRAVSMLRLNEELSRSLSAEQREDRNIQGILKRIREIRSPSSSQSRQIRRIQKRIAKIGRMRLFIKRIGIAAVLVVAAAAAYYFTALYNVNDTYDLGRALVLSKSFEDQEKRDDMLRILNAEMNRKLASGSINPERFLSILFAEGLASVSWKDTQAETVKYLISNALQSNAVVNAGIGPDYSGTSGETTKGARGLQTPASRITFKVPPPVREALTALSRGETIQGDIEGKTWLHGWIAFQKGDYHKAMNIYFKAIDWENPDQPSRMIIFLYAAASHKVYAYNRMEIAVNTMIDSEMEYFGEFKRLQKTISSGTSAKYKVMAFFMNGITSLFARTRPLRARHYLEKMHRKYPDDHLSRFYGKNLRKKVEQDSAKALSLQNAIPYDTWDRETGGTWELFTAKAPEGLVVVRQKNPEVNVGKHGVFFLTKPVIDRDFYAEWRFDMDEVSTNTARPTIAGLSILNSRTDIIYFKTLICYQSLPKGDKTQYIRFRAIYHYISPGIGFFKSKMWVEGAPEPEYRSHIISSRAIARKVALGVDVEGCTGTLDNFGFKYLPSLTEQQIASYKDAIKKAEKKLASDEPYLEIPVD